MNLSFLLYAVYGFISNRWFGWTFRDGEFWMMLGIMVLLELAHFFDED